MGFFEGFWFGFLRLSQPHFLKNKRLLLGIGGAAAAEKFERRAREAAAMASRNGCVEEAAAASRRPGTT